MFFAPLSIITNPFLVGLSEGRPNMFMRKVYGPGLATLYFIFAMYSQKKNILYKDCDHHEERNTNHEIPN